MRTPLLWLGSPSATSFRRLALPIAVRGAAVLVPFVLIAATSNAQIVPLVPGGVTVTPDGATTPVRVANTGGYSAVFTVTNTGGASATFTITCWGAGGVICTDVDQPTLTIAAGASKTDAATYDVGAPGTGRIVLRASNASAEDTGYFNVPIVALSGPPVALRNHNGDNRDRSLCLTSGAGEAAAWQCGDLTVTHGLPGYSTMGRERSLTLLYSSVQAVPRPIVAATVDETGLSVPLSVFVRLSLNGIPRDSATYNAWTTGPFARQIVIAHDGAADSSGIYPFTLMVRNQYADATSETSVSDTLLIVNRAASRYGTGWSLVGVEELRLNQPGNKILWIGGDGSAKVYRNIATDVWLAAAGAFRDTLVRFDSASASWYRRTMRHGVKVTFKSCCSGNRALHVRTTNRTGQSTVLTWSLDQTPLYPDTLKSITVPPGIAGTTYTLAYASGKLDRITDPAGRVLDATVSSGRLTSLLDPDTYSTGFGYDGVGRMTSRTTRRSYTTKFFYPQGLRVDSVKVPLNPSTGDTAKTVFYPWDERGLAVGPTGQTAVDTALIYTKVDGPRTNVGDTAVFRVDRWGAPTRITDPLGRVTTVARGNALVPALDTLVSYADGRRVRMLWNARGNLTEMRDSTSHLGVAGLPTAVTRWTYFSANTKDSPDTVIDPEGLKTRYVYNTWGLATDATAPNGHVTHFDYVPTGSLIGLVQAVTEQQVPAWDTLTKTKPLTNLRTGFAFNTLGNLLSDTSPMLRVRTYTRDGVQRVTRVYDPAGHNTEFVYDPLNRVLQSKQHVEPFDSGYAAPLVTWQYFGIDVLDSISDPRSVVRRYVYDAANRRTTEKNDYGVAEVTFYNRAGLVDSVVSRLGLTTRYVWDAGGQLTKKAWPARSPLLKDSILYTYDLMGRALTQTQPVRDRKITRTYFSRGLLKSEVQSLVNGTFPNTMTYAYDRNGRRTYHIIGTVGVLNSSDSIWYRYAAVSGDLAVVGVRWRNPISPPTPDSVQFVWDTLGRRSKVTYRRGVVIQYAYDGDGLLRLVCGTQSPDVQPAGYNAFKFTVYHQTVDVDGQIRRTTNYSTGLTGCGQNLGMLDVITASYDSRHQLLMHVAGIDSLIYRYDGSGNRTKKRNFVRGTTSLTHDETNNMDPLHNRLRMSLGYSGDSTVYTYDADGARLQESPYSNGQPQPTWLGYRNYFFDAMGRSTGTAEIFAVPQQGLQYVDNSTRCWYDPVGRPYGSCENGSPILGFDGPNAVRTGQDSYTYAYTFVQGPVTDDPLFGYNPGLPKYLYYVTDGQGRQYVVADTVGVNMSGDFAYYGAANGGKYAGGTTNASSFGASRNPNELGAAQLSAFRNRFYDQRTGRWTQEDPIGVAGGLNLYGYVGNNPVAYTDPFGLCPIKKDGVPCAVTFAAGGAAAGFATGVAASVAAAAPTLGGSLVISPATVTATTLTGLAGGALIGLAKDVSDNAQVLASAAAPLWDRIKRKVAGVATGIAIALGGGKSKEQEETNQTPPAVEQEAEQKPRDEP